MPEEISSERQRLFIAISLPSKVKARILAAQSTLKLVVEGGVRWATSEQLHLTLRFLGSIETPRVPALIDNLQAACAGRGMLTLGCAGIGFFPRQRSPRVIWAGVQEEGDRLRGLHDSIQQATKVFTREAQESVFTPHITLARVKDLNRTRAEALVKVALSLRSEVFGEWIAKSVELIRSQLSPQGARYSPVTSVPLEPVS